MFSVGDRLRRVLDTGRDKKNRKRRTSRRLLRIESLETRNLLAGNVTTSVTGAGDLQIIGDVLGNEVHIDQIGLAAGEYRITGVGSPATTVDGSTSPVVVTGVTRDLQFELDDGIDVVHVIGSDVARDVRFSGGDGGIIFGTLYVGNSLFIEGGSDVGRNVRVTNGIHLDNFILNGSTVDGSVRVANGNGDSLTEVIDGSTIGGNLTVTNGDGFDQLTIRDSDVDGRVRADNGDGIDYGGTVYGSVTDVNSSSAIGGNLIIRNGDGLDLLSLADSSIAGRMAVINGDGGSDTSISTGSVIVGNLTVLNGSGIDDVSISDATVVGRARILQGDGGGVVALSDSVFLDRLIFRGGDGVDDVRLESIIVSGRTNLRTGAGDDLFTITDSLFLSRVRIHGGTGTDTYTDGLGNLFVGGLQLVSIEIVI